MRTRFLIRFVVALAAAGASALAMAQTAAVPPGPRAPAQPGAPVRDPGGRPAVTPAPPGKGVLAGTITTASGQPAAGARVMLNGGDGPGRTTMTDASGQFVFEGLRTGRYYLNVTKPGFMSLSYGQRRASSPGTAIPLDDGQRRVIEMQLPRAAVITGMILDERGEPSINTQVRGMRYALMNGRRRAQQVANDMTDDRGIYRLHSLQPGEYAVCAVARNMGPMNDAQRIQMDIESVRRAIENAPSTAARQAMAERLSVLQAQRVDQTEPNLGYAPVCYPSSAAPSASVTVGAGEERSGIDLQMLMIPVARLEGTVVAPGGGAPHNVQLSLVNADDNMGDVDRQGTGTQQPSGRFSFQNVVPGRYTLTARTAGGDSVRQTVLVRVGLNGSAPRGPATERASILIFSPRPGSIATGGSTALCYAISGAMHARIDPGVGDVKPASALTCLRVTPARTTTYELTASGSDGYQVKRQLVIVAR